MAHTKKGGSPLFFIIITRVLLSLLENLEDVFKSVTNLFGRVSLTQGYSVVLHSLEVNGDSIGNTQFVIAGVTTADRSLAIISSSRYTVLAKDARVFANERFELSVAGQGEDAALEGCNDSGERQDIACFVVFADPPAMFQKSIQYTADTEGWFNDVGGVFTD